MKPTKFQKLVRFVAMSVTAIPVIGIVMLFVWAFGSNTNINRANWAKASLIWMAIGIAIAMVVFGMLGLAFFTGLTDV